MNWEISSNFCGLLRKLELYLLLENPMTGSVHENSNVQMSLFPCHYLPLFSLFGEDVFSEIMMS